MTTGPTTILFESRRGHSFWYFNEVDWTRKVVKTKFYCQYKHV
jgi:hypothetical protein